MPGKIAFIYPGQGAQKAFMGMDFYEQFEEVRKIFDKAQRQLDFELTDLCFRENALLHETAFTQPCLVAVSLAITKIVKDKGLVPDVTAGLSLGEYSAIAAAGGFEVSDAIALVRARGQYMEQAVPNHKGTMAAVLGLDGEQVLDTIHKSKGVWIANYNCPGQVVITGERKAVSEATPRLMEAGAKRVVPVNVSGPFHSPMMESAAEQLYSKLLDTNVYPLRIPYVANVTAGEVNEEDEIVELLTRQMTKSVLWEQSVKTMIEDGVDTFVEIGPGRTLSNFIRKIDSNCKTYQIGTVQQMEQVIGELVCKENR